jgi:hypothetical protein
MLNVNKITSQLSMMPDQALQKFAEMNKADPYSLALAVAESNRRKEMRAASQAQGAPTNPPKVADQAVAAMAPSVSPELSGVARLPAPNMQGMAGGGVVAFSGGGKAYEQIPTDGYPKVIGGTPVEDLSEFERNLFNTMSALPGASVMKGPTAARVAAPWLGAVFSTTPPKGEKSRKKEERKADKPGGPSRSGISQLTPQPIESDVRTREETSPPAVAGMGFQAKRSGQGFGAPSMKVEQVKPTQVTSFEDMLAAARAGAAPADEATDAAYKPFAQMLQEEREAVKGKDNTKDALIRAGLGMLASKSPYALQGIGEGAIQGFDVYQAAKKADQEALKANTQAQMLLMQAQRAERSGNMRDAMSLYGKYQEAVQAARTYDQRAQELKSTEANRRAQLELESRKVDQLGEYYRMMGGTRGGTKTLDILKAQLMAIDKELADKVLSITNPERHATLLREKENIKAQIAQLPGAATMEAVPSAADPLGIR